MALVLCPPPAPSIGNPVGVVLLVVVVMVVVETNLSANKIQVSGLTSKDRKPELGRNVWC